jgi:hypothetical protein
LKERKKVKKAWTVLCVLIVFSVVAGLFGLFAEQVYADTITDRIRESQGTGNVTKLERQVDESTSSLISMARRIFVTLTAVFGIWLALTFLKGGFSPDTLRDAKGRIGFFLVFLILAFWTEQILGFVFSLFGIDLSKL